MLTFNTGVLEQELFRDDGAEGGPEGDLPGGRQVLALQPARQLAGPGHHDAHGRRGQRQADEQRCQRFILAMAVIVVLVLRPGAHAHEHQYDDVRHEVRQRVHGVRNHRRRMPHETGHGLQPDQQQVHDASCQGYPRYLVFAFHTAKIRKPARKCPPEDDYCRTTCRSACLPAGDSRQSR